MTEDLRRRKSSNDFESTPGIEAEADQTHGRIDAKKERNNLGECIEKTESKGGEIMSKSSSSLSNPRLLLFFALLSATLFISLRFCSPFDVRGGIGGLRAGGEDGDGEKADLLYAVVFDAGSTGTRIHVFHFVRNKTYDGDGDEKHNGNDADNNNNPASNGDLALDLTHESFDHIEPGLSAYADDPLRIRPGLQRLLKVALDDIPASKLSSTPVILKATAGLRLLPATKADALLAEVRKTLIETGFRLNDAEEDVSILDGVDEGFYGWITVNYLLGLMGRGGGGKPKVATMDLGGGSTQITFDLNLANGDGNDDKVSVPQEFVKSVEILGEDAEIYTRSYLGLGIMAARLAILRKGTINDGGKDDEVDDFSINHNNLVSPCLPPWHEDVWTYGGVEYRVKAAPASSSAFLPSLDAAWGDCFSLASSVVASASVDKIPRKIIETRDFYAFSYYFDRLLEVGLISDPISGGVVVVSDVVDHASRVCRHFPVDKRPFLCMDLAHIAALLTSPSGLGFRGEDRLFLRKKIAGKEASWSLGSAFSLIGR